MVAVLSVDAPFAPLARDVDEPTTRSTSSLLINCAVTSAARFGFDWLSL